jgi:hypothetical protein
MWNISDYSAVDAANPTSDAGTFLPQVPPSLYQELTSPWTQDTLTDSLRPQVDAEAGCLVDCTQLVSSNTDIQARFAALPLSKQPAGGAGAPHPENFITDLYDEVFPGVRLSDSMCWTMFPWSPPVCGLARICVSILT